jgi:hypothetical protein
MLFLLLVVMFLVGGGVVPPLFGVAAGVIGILINHGAAHSTGVLTYDQGIDFLRDSVRSSSQHIRRNR